MKIFFSFLAVLIATIGCSHSSKLSNHSKIVLNHLFFKAPNKSFTEAILKSDFFKNEFSNIKQSTNANKKRNWTALYLHGEHTYLEIFPNDSDLPEIGIAFSVEKAGQADLVYQKLSKVNRFVKKPELTHSKLKDGRLIPWFYKMPLIEETEKYSVWFMEVRPEILQEVFWNKYGDKSYDGVSIDRKTYMSRLYKSDLIFRDISFIKIELDPKASNSMSTTLSAMGFVKNKNDQSVFSNIETTIQLVGSEKPRGLLELGFVVEGGKRGRKVTISGTTLDFKSSSYAHWVLQK